MDTRQHIVNTAFSLFIRKSYKDVTMKEVVAKTGLSKGAVYHYFSSKEALFSEAVVENFIGGFTEHFQTLSRESLRAFYSDYIVKSKEFLLHLGTVVGGAEFDAVMNIYLLMFEALTHLEGFRDAIIGHTKAEYDAWHEVISAARARGEIASCMTDGQIAEAFIFIADGIGLRAILHGSIDAMYDRVLSSWDALYHEIKA
jgi:AcrR family transcriptional regulator